MPKGIWYETSRSRWRVKIVRNRELIHRSYHHDYDEALRVWTRIQEETRISCRPLISSEPTSLIDQFLRQPRPGAGVVT
jgi:hypothetical protein